MRRNLSVFRDSAGAQVLREFLDYNDFLESADTLVAELGLDGVLQVALDTANTAINALRIAQDFTELICMNRRFYRTPSYRQRAANS